MSTPDTLRPSSGGSPASLPITLAIFSPLEEGRGRGEAGGVARRKGGVARRTGGVVRQGHHWQCAAPANSPEVKLHCLGVARVVDVHSKVLEREGEGEGKERGRGGGGEGEGGEGEGEREGVGWGAGSETVQVHAPPPAPGNRPRCPRVPSARQPSAAPSHSALRAPTPGRGQTDRHRGTHHYILTMRITPTEQPHPSLEAH